MCLRTVLDCPVAMKCQQNLVLLDTDSLIHISKRKWHYQAIQRRLGQALLRVKTITFLNQPVDPL